MNGRLMSRSKGQLMYLSKHILLWHLTVLKDQLAGVASTHAQFVKLLGRPKALQRSTQ